MKNLKCSFCDKPALYISRVIRKQTKRGENIYRKAACIDHQEVFNKWLTDWNDAHLLGVDIITDETI